MPPRAEKSSLKRGRHSTGEDQDIKKPRRSQRISESQSQNHDTPLKTQYLPSPLTHLDSNTTETYKEGTVTPSVEKTSQDALGFRQNTPDSSPRHSGLSSPPQDTQRLSQFVYPPPELAHELDDEDGTWGYLFPVNANIGHRLVLKKRSFCPAPIKPLEINRVGPKSRVIKKSDELIKNEERYESEKMDTGFPSGGYLIGRHPECDLRLEMPTISNRHCLLFSENRKGDTVSILEDLSSNGTFVNNAIVGRNKRRELEDGDEITILDDAKFVFRYPRSRESSAFKMKYRILQQLGKGHFATVYLCVERATGSKYAVKKFERRGGDSQRSQTEGLQQEIAVLMSVSHPNVLCLKDTFDETDGVYLILELAPEGELFNLIVSKQKLSEDETRKVFIQLFQGIKYLHERNIVHRDIKPENILLTNKDLALKIADFGLAKIIGEESFTTTLCGTPSYELYTRQNPYTLAQQIKMGRFDYPSPYWDPVGDPALDLIDRMLTVNVEKRITIDECLEHPWILNSNYINPADSTDGLTGAMDSLDFSKRKVVRERTLLANINDIKVTKTVVADNACLQGQPKRGDSPVRVKIWDKNPRGKNAKAGTQKTTPVKKAGKKEEHPAAHRQEDEFMQMGGKGDMQLFADDASSRYARKEVPANGK